MNNKTPFSPLWHWNVFRNWGQETNYYNKRCFHYTVNLKNLGTYNSGTVDGHYIYHSIGKCPSHQIPHLLLKPQFIVKPKFQNFLSLCLHLYISSFFFLKYYGIFCALRVLTQPLKLISNLIHTMRNIFQAEFVSLSSSMYYFILL